MIYKLGTAMSHIGHAPPEAEPWVVLHCLGIDVELAKRAVHKLYFEFVRNGPDGYSVYHDVFFIPNDTKHGTAFAMKYGTMTDE